MSLILTLLSLLVAAIFVPPYLFRVYRPYFAELMSNWRGADDDDPGADTSSDEPVLPQQHQVAPALVLDFAGVLDYLKRHNLTDEQAVDLLALARRESGDLLSANKIRDIVGGNEALVKARVASHRPKQHAPPARRLERPAGGW